MFGVVPLGLVVAFGLVAGTSVHSEADRAGIYLAACTKQGNVEICVDQADKADTKTTDTKASQSDRTGVDSPGSNQADVGTSAPDQSEVDTSGSDQSSADSYVSDQSDIEAPADEPDIEVQSDESSVDLPTDQSGFDSTAGPQWQNPTPNDSADARVIIRVDQLSQQMTVDVDGVRRFTWKVSTGKAGYWTPSGQFTPLRMKAEYFSREWDDAPMPHSIFFTAQGHAIHGSSHIAGLGTPASHGCIRLSPENAATLYALVAKEGMENTKVTIVHEIPVTSPYQQTRREVPAQGPRAQATESQAGSFWLRNRKW